MKNKSDLNLFFRSFGIVVIVIFAAIAAGICLFYYVFAIPAREGLSLASWPDVYTDNFSLQLEEEQGELKVKEFGIEDLDRYGLWLQVIDETDRRFFHTISRRTVPTAIRPPSFWHSVRTFTIMITGFLREIMKGQRKPTVTLSVFPMRSESICSTTTENMSAGFPP